MKIRPVSIYLFFVVVLLLMSVSDVFGQTAPKNMGTATANVSDVSEKSSAEEDPAIKKIAEEWKLIFDIIDKNYIEKIDHYSCYQKAQSKGVSACLDQYSGYYSEEEWRNYNSELDHQYAGVGMYMRRNGKRLVLFPLAGSPAAKAGILAEDTLLKVDDTQVLQNDDYSEKDLLRITNLVRGKAGTTVKITVLRESAVIGPIEIVREEIQTRSVMYEKMANGIGYVKINFFGDSTAEEFMNAMLVITDGDADTKVLFDLRGNGGGRLNAVLVMLSLMSPSEENTLITMKYKNSARSVHVKELAEKGLPACLFQRSHGVILTDEFSASASEIFSGTLRDWGNFKLAGTHTYGKGIGQAWMPIHKELPKAETSWLLLTTFQYLVGNSQTPVITGKGLSPDYPVEEKLSDAEKEQLKNDWKKQDPNKPYLNPALDKTLKKALEVLAEKN